MKKQYIQPSAEIVKLNVNDSLLDDIGIINNSREVTDEGLAKEHNFFFDDEEEDILPSSNTALWGEDDEDDEW